MPGRGIGLADGRLFDLAEDAFQLIRAVATNDELAFGALLQIPALRAIARYSKELQRPMRRHKRAIHVVA